MDAATPHRSLLNAIIRNDVEAVQEALAAERSSVDRQWDDATPMHYAAVNARDIRILELLLQNGADVDCRDSQGQTPLHVAGKIGNGIMIRALLERGADENALDAKGRKPNIRSALSSPHLMTKDDRSPTR